MHEDVGYFQISMDYIFLCEIIQSFEDILDDGFGLVFIEVSLFPQPGLEVALVAEFGDDIAVSVAGEDFIAFEHIGVIELFEYVNLREKQFLQLFAL
jgi:hypothetical protein